MVFDELDVRVTADTGSFERGIDSAERSLSSFNPQALETAAALQVLQGRADEAGDELFDIAPRATTAAVGLEGVSIGATSASISFSGLAAVTVASLLPAIVALSAALVPVVAAFGGFIAVAGSILGLGVAGAIGAISTNTQQLKTSAMAVAETFRDVFAPVINAATVTLSNLLNQLEQVAPELALTTDEATEIGNLFTELGSAIIDLLPALVDLGVSLTQQFLPPFIDFVERVGPRIPGIIQNLVRVFSRLVPTLRGIGRFISRFGPEFLEFGFVVLNVLTPAIAGFGNAIGRTLRFVTNLDQSLQGLIAGVSLVAPVVLGLATLLGGPVTAAIVGVTGAVVVLERIWSQNILNIQQRVQSIRAEIVDWAQTVFNVFSTQLQPVFADLQQLVRDNQEEFSIIADGVQALIEGLFQLSAFLVRTIVPALGTVLVPILRGVIDVLDVALTKIAQFIELTGAIQGGNIDEALDITQEIAFGSQNPRGQVTTPDQQAANRIEVVLEENTDVVDSRIEGVAETRAELVVQQQSDQAQRNSGSSGLSGL